MENKEPSVGLQKVIALAQEMLLPVVCAAAAELILQNFTPSSKYYAVAGRTAILFLALYVVHRFALQSLRRYRPTLRDLSFLVLVIVGSICIDWLGRILAISFSTYSSMPNSPFPSKIDPDALAYAIPYSTGALLMQAVLGLHFGLVFSLCMTLIVGMYSPGNFIIVPYLLSTMLAACLSLSRCRTRSAYLRAGLNIILVSLPFALASTIISNDFATSDIIIKFAGVFIGGGLAAFLASGFTPVAEALGGYSTDMRLLEMATLDHPLLKELSISAPGTWNHSMVMGMMVESAADAISANAVIARVGAYFHDIGKMKKPLYFVENQPHGENRHDKLSTSMSALIIKSHVKDGIELARKHKLPKIIEDMIPQHHGTSLIEYFYDKANREAKEADENAPDVDPSSYSYPGPKPQTREAGLLMLADGVEAAARTLSDPTHDRIQGLVQKMINKVFASGELDECELTLRDLHQIAKSFTRVLTGIYHQRIAYDEPAEKVSEKEEEESVEESEEASAESLAKEVGGAGAAKKSKGQTSEEEDREDGKEDLKRLGI